MQTLFNKKRNLIKKNNALINTFFINMIIITILSLQLIPFINIKVVISIIISLFISEGVIVKKVKNNEEIIKILDIEIDNLKKMYQKKEMKEDDKNLFLLKEELNNYFTKEKEKILVKINEKKIR